jgi:hypothetical protein
VSNDNIRIAAASAVGALLGGVAGFLFLTERGRSVRREMGPALEDLREEIAGFGKSLEGASGIAREGWKFIQELAAEPPTRFPGPRSSVSH